MTKENMKNYDRKEIGVFGTYYYLDDKLHRTDGPAVDYTSTSGTKYWYINGKLHRTNGPACEWSNGRKSWYINGTFIGSNDKGFTEQKFEQYLKLLLLR